MVEKFKAFPTDRVCDFNNDKIHFNHPSCCREKDFSLWRESYIKPLFDWEIANPLPNFKRVRPCDKTISTHKDHRYCCNEDILEKFNDFLNKSFKLLPLVYTSEISWQRLSKYEIPNTLRIPLPLSDSLIGMNTIRYRILRKIIFLS